MSLQTETSAARAGSDLLVRARDDLRQHVEAENFAGYDPYDALNGWIPFHWGGKWCQAVVTQVHKRNPVNLRKLMGIAKGRNPKAIGLFLSAYSLLAQGGRDEGARKVADQLFEWLLENRSDGCAGSCWGYNFDWVNPTKRVSAGVPSVVVTAFVAKGVLAYFHLTDDERAREVLLSCCEYVLKMLPRTETSEGLCFSYTHLQKDCCYNANMLAAEILAMGYSLTRYEPWAGLARRATEFTLAHQKEDGRWNYSLDWQTGTERVQIDFHQGFILDSLEAVLRLVDPENISWEESLAAGARFYRGEQFFADGRSTWRWPREWPADIHNQAQGILTFARLGRLDRNWLSFAERIACWTIENMRDNGGYFYYRKFPRYINRTDYIRWGQAWMLLALVELIGAWRDLRE